MHLSLSSGKIGRSFWVEIWSSVCNLYCVGASVYLKFESESHHRNWKLNLRSYLECDLCSNLLPVTLDSGVTSICQNWKASWSEDATILQLIFENWQLIETWMTDWSYGDWSSKFWRSAEVRMQNHTSCPCCSKPTVTAQSLDEMAFLKGACHASQYGDIQKLKKLIAKDSRVLHTDGTSEGNVQLQSQRALDLHKACRFYISNLLISISFEIQIMRCNLSAIESLRIWWVGHLWIWFSVRLGYSWQHQNHDHIWTEIYGRFLTVGQWQVQSLLSIKCSPLMIAWGTMLIFSMMTEPWYTFDTGMTDFTTKFIRTGWRFRAATLESYSYSFELQTQFFSCPEWGKREGMCLHLLA